MLRGSIRQGWTTTDAETTPPFAEYDMDLFIMNDLEQLVEQRLVSCKAEQSDQARDESIKKAKGLEIIRLLRSRSK